MRSKNAIEISIVWQKEDYSIQSGGNRQGVKKRKSTIKRCIPTNFQRYGESKNILKKFKNLQDVTSNVLKNGFFDQNTCGKLSRSEKTINNINRKYKGWTTVMQGIKEYWQKVQK